MSRAGGEIDLGRGFIDPVLGAQRCFRAILSAMSEPGTVHDLGERIEAPRGVTAAAALVLLALADQETPVWLTPALRTVAAPFIRFHCGAAIVEAPADARFALLDGVAIEPGLMAFDAGDDRYPDRSATLIIQCAALHGGQPVSLSGPGINCRRQVAPAGLHAAFWREAAANADRYPLGIDLILAAGASLLAIPRSTRIASAGEAP